MMDYGENLQKRHEYVKALEEERRKIEMFQRELPLCLELVTRAIHTCKKQLSGTAAAATTTTTDYLNGQSECSEQTINHGPVLEEFIPIKRSCSSAQDREEGDAELESHNSKNNDKSWSSKKSAWLKSVQLWKSPDLSTSVTSKEEQQSKQPRIVSVLETKRNGGAFHPFKKEKISGDDVSSNTKDNTTTTVLATAAFKCSTAHQAAVGGCGISKKDDAGKEGGQDQSRKARRCWSPELHRSFLNALQQLGGSHVATPKQIRELMNVDGLTNDEVKSHLQKYRLHSRRPTPAVHSNASRQAPQFVVVGGIWVPPPEYAAVPAAGTTVGEATTAVTAAPPTRIYAPVATPAPTALPYHQATANLAQRKQHKQSSQSGSEVAGGARCSSSATSSSTHTTTASAAC